MTNPPLAAEITGIVRDPADRRREPRFTTREMVSITVVWSGQSERSTGIVEDVSRSGIGLVSVSPLTPGATVFVRLRQSGIFGTVRHCREIDSESFRCGVSIEHVVTPQAISDHLNAEDLEQFIRRDPIEAQRKADICAHILSCRDCADDLAVAARFSTAAGTCQAL